jgi:thioesterase domain-containing protein
VGRSFADHEPEPYPDRVALYRAEHQPLGIVADPFMGWRETLTGDVEVCQIPGYHDSVLAATRIDALAAVLQATLQQVKHDSPAPAGEQAE